jgi:opacity protein-like surface antigen
MQYTLCGGRMIPFAEGKAAWGSSKETYTSGSTSNTFKWGTSQYAIGPGLALFLTDNLTMDIMVVYQKVTWKDKDTAETTKYHDSVFGFAFGLSFMIPPCW